MRAGIAEVTRKYPSATNLGCKKFGPAEQDQKELSWLVGVISSIFADGHTVCFVYLGGTAELFH